MYDISFILDRFHCNRESDFGGAEPYMWTLFFHLDISEIFSSLPLTSYTPHKNWTTRGMYANGVGSGDDVLIPPSMGRYETALEDAGLDAMLAGFLCVLIDQDSTDGDAIKAGHTAFADSAHASLNELARELVGQVLDGETPDVPEARIAQMSQSIRADVEGAIRAAQTWHDLLDNQDDFIGFGYGIFDATRIKGAAEMANPINIAIKIRRERTVNHQNRAFTLVDEYDVFGHFIASTPKRPDSLAWPEFEGYDKAVADFTATRAAIGALKFELLKAGGKADPKLVGEVRKHRDELLPRAKRELIARFPKEWKDNSEEE